ncbi:MAG: cytochrome ubiquinol oxidase subunit I [Alphaproteobacteria bacterium]|jgi:cytochrome d ubiquinol oxidase subunit I|nr:cytochrome ubiquinol oxidase subunit I [Alphaproteobacteria bacterium]
MDFDPLLLSRIQFGFTVAFHILFPAFTIGLASWLVVLEARWLFSKRERFRTLYRFWVKVFAVSFGLGVVSGVVMSYQFGTNWSAFSDMAGNIVGPLMGYEVLTAFFLEASFLGIMLFGWKKVGNRLHFLATSMVALGTLISAFWILSANSWMQTPSTFEMVDGRAVPTDWLAAIFNPSFPYRFAHMVMAAYLTTAFAVAGMSAWMLLRDPANRGARTSLSMALWFAVIFSPVQILLGDLQGLNVRDYQPVKLAAMEGHWQNEPGEGVPLVLFGWPDEEAERNLWSVEIPNLSSVIITHSWDGQFPALTEFPEENRPPVAIVFWSFRIMVLIGFLMLGLGLWSLYLRWRKRLYRSRTFLYATFAMLPSGFVAVLTGWITAEVGRQPWVVYGLMRTSEAVSPVSGEGVAFSLALFVVVYAIIFGAGTYYLFKLLAQGPEDTGPDEGSPPFETRRPKRPLSRSEDRLEEPGPAE